MDFEFIFAFYFPALYFAGSYLHAPTSNILPDNKTPKKLKWIKLDVKYNCKRKYRHFLSHKNFSI